MTCGLWSAHFSTDRHQIPYRVEIKQRRLCTQWLMRPEIQIGFSGWLPTLFNYGTFSCWLFFWVHLYCWFTAKWPLFS